MQNMFKVNGKNTGSTPMLYLTYFTPCSSIFVVKFEQVIAGWDNLGIFIVCIGAHRCSHGPLETYKTESFTAIVNNYYPLTIVAKFSILDACGGPGYTSGPSSHIFWAGRLFLSTLFFTPCKWAMVFKTQVDDFG